MSEAVFALAGALVGVLGTLGTEFLRARRDERRLRTEVVQRAAADFVSLISDVVQISLDMGENPNDDALLSKASDANRAMRAQYERLRLVASRCQTQEAARHMIRYAYGIQRMALGRPPREDEHDREPLALVADWMVTFCIEVRKETGVSEPENVYREPSDWIGLGRLTWKATSAGA
jgi:hypothetical protein